MDLRIVGEVPVRADDGAVHVSSYTGWESLRAMLERELAGPPH